MFEAGKITQLNRGDVVHFLGRRGSRSDWADGEAEAKRLPGGGARGTRTKAAFWTEKIAAFANKGLLAMKLTKRGTHETVIQSDDPPFGGLFPTARKPH